MQGECDLARRTRAPEGLARRLQFDTNSFRSDTPPEHPSSITRLYRCALRAAAFWPGAVDRPASRSVCAVFGMPVWFASGHGPSIHICRSKCLTMRDDAPPNSCDPGGGPAGPRGAGGTSASGIAAGAQGDSSPDPAARAASAARHRRRLASAHAHDPSSRGLCPAGLRQARRRLPRRRHPDDLGPLVSRPRRHRASAGRDAGAGRSGALTPPPP